MNKEELIKLVESLNLSADDYYILSSCSMLMYGLRKKANDLDLCVTPLLFETLKKRYNIDLNTKNECGFYIMTDLIEIVVSEKADFKRDFKDGYPVESLKTILEFKQGRNLEKDKNDIKAISDYLSINSFQFKK